ncbi:hypothetical protein [Microvirga sp. VF16]|uniref:hypothetical protein n=1 Tax=Microvirga sp. VF16 TaxID=2807101 RepID=UPI00193E0071|nr:hypothetical protein [Microvirga sp. VF16]QRM28982.1 hypothetical protein JO965_22740 [Microvirga sp. VF16]
MAGLLGVVGWNAASEGFQWLKFYNNYSSGLECGWNVAAALKRRFELLKDSYFPQRTVDLNPCPGSNTATAFTDARKDMKNG